MSGYAKFMEELVTKERLLDCEILEISQTCSTVMTNNDIVKKKDPRAFTIPCTIAMCTFANALCDPGLV